MVPIFIFYFSFKVCNTAFIVPNFCENFVFHQFFLYGFRMNYSINPEESFSYILSGYVRVT